MDVEAEVMRKYPRDEEERHCAMIRNMRNACRQEYRIKLLNEQRTAGNIRTEEPAQDAAL